MNSISHVEIFSPLAGAIQGKLQFLYKNNELSGAMFIFRDAIYKIENKEFSQILEFLDEMEPIFYHENKVEEWNVLLKNLSSEKECLIKVLRKNEVFPSIKGFLLSQQNKKDEKKPCILI